MLSTPQAFKCEFGLMLVQITWSLKVILLSILQECNGGGFFFYKASKTKDLFLILEVNDG